jgi:hypothetical protein
MGLLELIYIIYLSIFQYWFITHKIHLRQVVHLIPLLASLGITKGIGLIIKCLTDSFTYYHTLSQDLEKIVDKIS